VTTPAQLEERSAGDLEVGDSIPGLSNLGVLFRPNRLRHRSPFPRGSPAAGAGPSWVGGTRRMPSGFWRDLGGGGGHSLGGCLLAPGDWRDLGLGTVSRIQALPTALFNGLTPLGMSNTNAMKQLRGPNHENWPVCDPRAAPPGEYGLKSGENGHLARANGAIDGPYCSPTWTPGPVCLEGGLSRWLVGVVGLGGGAAQAPTRGAWGASSIRAP
jgi:hypothetical protein